MSDSVIGKCPLCKKQLEQDSTARFLICPDEHFKISFEDWTKIWDKHTDALNTALATLLTELKNANLK